ncbi:MAG TPA: hypothetical protein VMD99_13630 [Terriglobales bacterium]|nr:hypothetical protein [Terriglobales bacterium]
MRLLRRILITIVVTLAVIFVAIRWIGPVAFSFYSAKKALPVAKIVPADLVDVSVSQAPGMKLSYLGYEFEIPWTDLDETKTTLYPTNKPEKTMAVLAFKSGLRLMVMAAPPRSFTTEMASDLKMSPQAVEAVFGPGAATSDYIFARNVYRFTPASMHYWSLSPALHYREQVSLMIKEIMPVKSAETGIFNLHHLGYQGFQQGDPRVRQNNLLLLTLYGADGAIEISIIQDKYRCPSGVTQPEINRIVQSLHKVSPDHGKS